MTDYLERAEREAEGYRKRGDPWAIEPRVSARIAIAVELRRIADALEKMARDTSARNAPRFTVADDD